jgi:hypothetical protein
MLSEMVMDLFSIFKIYGTSKNMTVRFVLTPQSLRMFLTTWS